MLMKKKISGWFRNLFGSQAYKYTVEPQQLEMVQRYGQWYPVSTIEDPLWYMDQGQCLNWLFRIPDSETNTLVWFIIEERNIYCDRGHYRVYIEEGQHALHIDGQDARDSVYYMSLLTALAETKAFAMWRVKKIRHEPYAQLRQGTPDKWHIPDPRSAGLMHNLSYRTSCAANLGPVVPCTPEDLP